jgi:hypothetical protein
LLPASGWLHLNYATGNLHLKTWCIFLLTYNQNRLNALTPSMEKLSSLSQKVPVAAPEKELLFTVLQAVK